MKKNMAEYLNNNYQLKSIDVSKEIDIDISNIAEMLGFEHKFDDIESAFRELNDFYKDVAESFEDILDTSLDFCSKNGKMVVTNKIM